MNPPVPACRTVNLSVAYRRDPVLRRVDFEAPVGVVMGVVGPNGAGKSTLLKAMLGLVTPLTGHSEFFGQRLDAVRRRVGYMPQATTVDWDFPTTVADVVLMGTYGGLGWFRRPGRAERQRAVDALDQTGMADLATRQIGELSGGSANASSWPGRWRSSPTCTSWTSPSRASTPAASRPSLRCCTGCAPRAAPWSSSITTWPP